MLTDLVLIHLGVDDMNHIGKVIKQFRDLRELSRAELAKGICSEKYVYLIEKGKRTPSTQIMRHFCNKLKTDLFLYYEYLDCKDPINTYFFICEFNKRGL